MLKKTLEVVKNTLETLSSMPHLSSRLWKIIILTLLKASIIVLFPLYIIKFSQVETILTNNTAVISFMLISASAALLLRTIPTIIDKLVMPIALYYYSQTTSNVAKQFYNLSIDNRLSNPVGEVTQSISANYAIIPSFIPPIFNNIIPVTIEGLLLLTLLTFFYGPISLVLIGLLSLQIFIATYFSSLIKKKENKHTEKIYDFYAALHPALNNYENAHLFNNDECEVKHLSQKLEDISQTYAQSYSAKKYTSLLVQFTLTAILFIVATYIAYSLSHGNLIISDIILIGIYGLLFLPEIEGFIQALTTLSTATSDIIKTNEFLSRSPSVREENNATSLNVNRESAVVEFKNVYFSHEQIPILNNVSFIAYPGEKIALVGLSGAGKSTIFKLLFRFYDVDSGTIKINQQDIKQVTLQSLRSSISVVPQDTILFTGTLKENIQYGNLQANEEELINATQQAELTELIQTRGGLDVSIGEEGLKLSGGQRQRISIARALLKKGVIYLFDEATSSLDPTTSMSIQKTLDKISKNHTTLFITHDLLTVTNADKIIFLDPTGKISEIGTFTELVKQESNFYKYMLNYCQSSGIELSQLIKKRNLVNSAV